MNIKEIQEMIKLMQENDIVEFQLERNGFKILLKRGKTHEEPTPIVSQVSKQPVASEKEEIKEQSKFIEITSPMVGTFYASPSPESAPYLQVGQQVQVGDIVCIIEAMKVMNEIKSEVSGEILEILTENGQPVEFGQPLFKLKP
jgi:acetyl-CoA carboxylase biotin carboxyl carrier protein